jgi:hypothetical protein
MESAYMLNLKVEFNYSTFSIEDFNYSTIQLVQLKTSTFNYSTFSIEVFNFQLFNFFNWRLQLSIFNYSISSVKVFNFQQLKCFSEIGGEGLSEGASKARSDGSGWVRVLRKRYRTRGNEWGCFESDIGWERLSEGASKVKGVNGTWKLKLENLKLEISNWRFQ